MRFLIVFLLCGGVIGCSNSQEDGKAAASLFNACAPGKFSMGYTTNYLFGRSVWVSCSEIKQINGEKNND